MNLVRTYGKGKHFVDVTLSNAGSREVERYRFERKKLMKSFVAGLSMGVRPVLSYAVSSGYEEA